MYKIYIYYELYVKIYLIFFKTYYIKIYFYIKSCKNNFDYSSRIYLNKKKVLIKTNTEMLITTNFPRF